MRRVLQTLRDATSTPQLSSTSEYRSSSHVTFEPIGSRQSLRNSSVTPPTQAAPEPLAIVTTSPMSTIEHSRTFTTKKMYSTANDTYSIKPSPKPQTIVKYFTTSGNFRTYFCIF